MPQLLLLAALGTGAYLGVKWLRRKSDDFQRELRRAMDEAQARAQPQKPAPDEIQTLKPDPVTGVYRIEEK